MALIILSISTTVGCRGTKLGSSFEKRGCCYSGLRDRKGYGNFMDLTSVESDHALSIAYLPSLVKLCWPFGSCRNILFGRNAHLPQVPLCP